MKLRWNFRCYPTRKQEQSLAQTFGCVRFVYNHFLAERTKAFKDGKRMNYVQSSSELTVMKMQPEHIWLNDVSSIPLQQSLRNLQTAYRNFFEKRTGYPAFKKKSGKQTAEYTRSGFRFEIGNQRLIIAKLGRIKVKWSRKMNVDPSTVTIMRKPSGKYFISCVVDINPAPLPETGKEVGIDVGINRLATLSTGERISNPKFMNKYHKRMKRIQKDLARKKKGSARYNKCKQRLARFHEKISDSRKDVINKLAWNLVTRFDTIYVEDLNIRGMVKNHRLARSLSDASIGMVIRTIETKSAMHGKKTIKIDRWFPSSKMCCICGNLQQNMPLSVRNWTCRCGAVHDRDDNASINIMGAGQSLRRGDGVRPV